MKKTLLLGGLFLMLVGTSCKKDYVCECTTDIAGTKTTTSVTYTNVSKKDAEAACNVTVASTTCVLK